MGKQYASLTEAEPLVPRSVVAPSQKPSFAQRVRRALGNKALAKQSTRPQRFHDEINPDAYSGDPTLEGMAESEIDRATALLDSDFCGQTVEHLRKALGLVGELGDTDLGKQLKPILETSHQAFLKSSDEILAAQMALQAALTASQSGERDAEILTRTTAAVRNDREALAQSLRGVLLAIEEAGRQVGEFRKAGAERNAERLYGNLHPTADAIIVQLKSAATGVAVVSGIVGTAVAMPQAAVIVKGVLSTAIAAGSFGAKKYQRRQDVADEQTREELTPLISSGNDLNNLEGKVSKGMIAAGLVTTAAGHFLGVGGLGAPDSLLGSAEAAGTNSLIRRTQRHDLDVDAARVGKGVVDLEHLEDEFGS